MRSLPTDSDLLGLGLGLRHLTDADPEQAAVVVCLDVVRCCWLFTIGVRRGPVGCDEGVLPHAGCDEGALQHTHCDEGVLQHRAPPNRPTASLSAVTCSGRANSRRNAPDRDSRKMFPRPFALSSTEGDGIRAQIHTLDGSPKIWSAS